MTQKVFISYSHIDEPFRQELEDHLAMLKRDNLISVWHDRKIDGGDNWKNEIDKNLDSADIILFLISSKFLASDYCMDVEVARAIEKEEEGTGRLIPIIIRPVDWQASQLSKFQAFPKDALAITKWENQDEAWVDVTQRLRRVLADFVPNTVPVQSQLDLSNDIKVSNSTLDWLNSTEISFSHRHVDLVKLSHIFVWPDLLLDQDVKDIEIIDSKKLVSQKGRYFITGEEQQGKTTLLKAIYKEALLGSIVPIYIDVKNLKSSDLNKMLEKALNSQYENLDLNKSQDFEVILLIDNLDENGLNRKGLNRFLESVEEYCDWVVITAHESYSLMASDITYLAEYKEAEIQGLGHYKREEIARKWISLGQEETIEDKELYKRCEEISAYLNSIIRKNILPPKPIYILMLMQMHEASTKQNLDMTSHGHCYQKLIYQDLEKAKVKSAEIEKYMNFLTELAWTIFSNEGPLNLHFKEEFFKQYNNTFMQVDGNRLIATLSHVPILKESDGLLSFSYPYIYYFFTAKKIAEGYQTKPEVKDAFEKLLAGFHREDYSNILVFITHHSKEKWVTDEINNVLSGLFKEQTESKLNNEQLSFMDDFLSQIPQLIIQTKSIQESRDERNKRLDKLSRENADDERENDDVPSDILVSINKTFKGMEISGQILKSRHATLEKSILLTLAENGTSTGLRFLDYFISISDSTKTEVINIVLSLLSESSDISNSELEDQAKKAYYHLVYSVINGVVRKIASSVGSREAYEIYVELEQKSDSPAITLIKQAIDLQFNRNIDFVELERTNLKLKSNPVCQHILKEIVVQHVYMFPTDYKEKQRLEELFGLPVKRQRLFDSNKRGKG
ncbi:MULTISPECIES: toll/interleukin-1 receptor domain-containing protein [Gammaproteobacteria]|uniref:toll/interleukin-1 receptor domain-containing protein n=1 Tax=Gammaproteobacteria TaxID=1236 RepID=UPI000DCFB6C8|nr:MULTISPECIES: toll/interleukin-1 receptor domain-containing protein [Gammaproteobacteria]RTE85520.1 toll/interleukin-1 receptor domain-containing protein [Aliidiomarina sp. B3213]TCZ89490.1 toll/interleukin-1 receptor domain-containing protein [Lysobacter sp. N42]